MRRLTRGPPSRHATHTDLRVYRLTCIRSRIFPSRGEEHERERERDDGCRLSSGFGGKIATVKSIRLGVGARSASILPGRIKGRGAAARALIGRISRHRPSETPPGEIIYPGRLGVDPEEAKNQTTSASSAPRARPRAAIPGETMQQRQRLLASSFLFSFSLSLSAPPLCLWRSFLRPFRFFVSLSRARRVHPLPSAARKDGSVL